MTRRLKTMFIYITTSDLKSVVKKCTLKSQLQHGVVVLL